MNRIATGFTLLEVMVALVVISIGMTAALSTTSSNVDVLSAVERRTYANWVADNIIVELQLQGVASTGEIKGDSKMAGKTWFWQAEIKPTFDTDVLQVRLKVSESESLEAFDAYVTGYLKAAAS